MRHKRKSPPAATGGARKSDCLEAVSSSIPNRRPLRQGRKSLRSEIYAFICAHPGATFRDLEELPGVRGDYALKTSGGVVLWPLSRAAGRAVLELLQQGLIEAQDADPSEYEKPAYVETVELVPGYRARAWRIPLLPLVDSHRVWVPTPCWCPTTLRACDAWAERADEARVH